ncbi:MAG: NAD(P)-dependent oxidoreductase [Thermoleophilia bacterium]|nr:NAD(P)-dependent oxidoreductase [Thermoleophilia bacterium]
MSRHVVTGATGALGRSLVSALRSRGLEVTAVVRTPAQAPALVEAGAGVVVADLTRPGSWQDEIADATVVWHTAAPRLEPPVRRRAVGRRERAAARMAELVVDATEAERIVLASSMLSSRGPAGDGTALGRISTAAESRMPVDRTSIVRLGWPYNPESFLAFMVRGLLESRYRIVAEGTNRMPLISLPDATAALVAAGDGPPGTWSAHEPDVPTQKDLVHHLCAETGARRPDHLPVAMASLSFGRVLAEALTWDADCGTLSLVSEWAPSLDWRSDLVSAVGGGPG